MAAGGRMELRLPSCRTSMCSQSGRSVLDEDPAVTTEAAATLGYKGRGNGDEATEGVEHTVKEPFCKV